MNRIATQPAAASRFWSVRTECRPGRRGLSAILAKEVSEPSENIRSGKGLSFICWQETLDDWVQDVMIGSRPLVLRKSVVGHLSVRTHEGRSLLLFFVSLRRRLRSHFRYIGLLSRSRRFKFNHSLLVHHWFLFHFVLRGVSHCGRTSTVKTISHGRSRWSLCAQHEGAAKQQRAVRGERNLTPWYDKK